MRNVADDYMRRRYTPPGQPRPLKGDREAARERARAALRDGLRVTWEGATAVVPSASRPGIRYRVEQDRCSCDAAMHEAYCYHLAAVELLRERGEAPAPPKSTSRYTPPANAVRRRSQ